MRLISSLLALAAATFAPLAQAAYLPYGIQLGTSVAQVQSWGWTVCYQDNGFQNTSMQTIMTGCSGTHMMLADGAIGAATFNILAAARREDVLLRTGGPGDHTTHTANGAEWYFSDDWSMGYTALGNTVYRNSCDINLAGWYDVAPTVGSCWHTGNGNLNGGWAFNDGQFQGTLDRFILVANHVEEADVPEPGSLALMGLALAAFGAARARRKA